MNMLRLIAEKTGLSQSTVSRIMNGKNKGVWDAKADQAAHVRKIAAELGYRPSAAARSIRQKKGRNIGIIVSDLKASLWANPIMHGMNRILKQANYVPSVIPVGSLAEAEQIPIMKERFFEALVCIGGGQDVKLNEYLEAVSPFCIWMESSLWKNVNCLRRDEFSAAYTAVEQAVRCGYKKFVFACLDKWPAAHFAVYEREAGARKAAEDFGIKMDFVEIIMLPEKVHAFDDIIASGMEKDTALIAWDTGIANYIIHTAMHRRKIPGEDFGLVCCDDSEYLLLYEDELSRVGFNREEAGAKAAEFIMKMLNGEIEEFASFRIKYPFIPGSTLRRQ